MTKEPFGLLTLLLFSATLWSAPSGVGQTTSQGQITDAEIDRAIERDASEMIDLRHQVHQHPESSNREFQTSKLVAERLRALGLEVQTGIAHTGVVGVLKARSQDRSSR